ncbi:MAG TPA: hypothetical protein EYP33_03975 [Pyrodictium sp.]|nr:hypothetical protein [Pyrodictium sp.]
MEGLGMTSRAVEKASKVQALLQSSGFYVSRHASSMLVMHFDRIVATLHVYDEECRLHVYRPWMSENREALEQLRTLLARLCSSVVEKTMPGDAGA